MLINLSENFIKYYLWRYLRIRLDCLKPRVKYLFTIKGSYFRYKLLHIYYILTFGIKYSFIWIQGINNTRKDSKWYSKGILKIRKWTIGLPKGRNSYGNGVFIVDDINYDNMES